MHSCLLMSDIYTSYITDLLDDYITELINCKEDKYCGNSILIGRISLYTPSRIVQIIDYLEYAYSLWDMYDVTNKGNLFCVAILVNSLYATS